MVDSNNKKSRYLT